MIIVIIAVIMKMLLKSLFILFFSFYSLSFFFSFSLFYSFLFLFTFSFLRIGGAGERVALGRAPFFLLFFSLISFSILADCYCVPKYQLIYIFGLSIFFLA